jgi:hypothetical protein
MTRPRPDPARRERLDAACLRVADTLGVDPEDVLHDGTHVSLTVDQIDQLLGATPAGETCPACGGQLERSGHLRVARHVTTGPACLNGDDR